jgi:hypothetical protein
MAAVPVEDAGVGSAVNDVSRELGSALGVAILGSVINAIYRSNVEEGLAGVVPDETVELAQEGIGVVAASLPSLPAEIGGPTFATASESFIEAMSTGFWLSAAIMGSAVVVAGFLLPNSTRTIQVERNIDLSNEEEEQEEQEEEKVLVTQS